MTQILLTIQASTRDATRLTLVDRNLSDVPYTYDEFVGDKYAVISAHVWRHYASVPTADRITELDATRYLVEIPSENSSPNLLPAKLMEYVAQRPNFSAMDYADTASFRNDRYVAQRDLQRAKKLISELRNFGEWKARVHSELKSGRGRLRYGDDGKIDYITGQYWCTEFRGAAVRLLEDKRRD